ncbi:helix-turn-helix domain-containing protein [Riemerella anatipestifer]|uniref:LexA family transcriptional regulator n=1 Tax=Riemerella anatipestifer TaxID=34085 RepID=UPI001626C0D5|nr:S24 family peptidase [Riemerella anatipestifer]WPC10772.1 helix-turn-helix domain-containing protein [Riemerella anatipestifer]WPC13577.1 helix-turn-helix domain-containing protein [Riemerella anatipestifer]WPC14648.1 helix-turn-helix domain-containing protein [Riemerella anatipestifer]
MSNIIDKSLILKKIKEVYDFKSDTEFANFLGVKPQTISSWHSRNTFDTDLIYSKCVNINADFLLSGEGEVLKPNVKEKLYNESITNSITESITNQMYKKGYTSVEEIEKGVKLYQVNEDIDQYKGTGIPLIPIEAMAGFGAGDIQVMDYETSSYRVPEFTELKADFMIRVKGSSMYPKYSSGDLVACKKLYLSDIFFQWNKVYVLDTAQGAIIKRVKKGTDKEHILLVSENPNYDPFELHLSQVNALALVVGVIRLE